MLFVLGWFEKKNSEDKKQAPRSTFNAIYPTPDPYHGFFEKRDSSTDGDIRPAVEEEPPDPEPD